MKKRIKKFIKNVFIFLSIVLFFAWIKLDYIIERLLFQPTKLNKDYVFTFERTFEELFLYPDKDAVINALHFKVKEPKGVILYFHGNRDNLQRWGNISSELTRYNYDVFVVDYRGYGKSRGNRTEETINSDALFCYNYIKNNYAPKEIIIYGRSLGTGVAACLAATTNPHKLILETPYYSVKDLIEGYFSLVSVENKMRYKFPSFENLQHVNCPILILHGNKDEVVPYESGKKLFDGLTNKKARLVTINNGKHNNLNTFSEYWTELTGFMENTEGSKK
jgi:uncharacterized protein